MWARPDDHDIVERMRAAICVPILPILDWEGWGLAPSGYDAAVLHSYSLLLLRLAARIRNELAPLLDTPTGRFAELVAITQLLHSTSRGNNLDLARTTPQPRRPAAGPPGSPHQP